MRSIFFTLFLASSLLAQPYQPVFLLDEIGNPDQAVGAYFIYPLGDQDGDGFDDILISVFDPGYYMHLRLIYGGPTPPYRNLEFGYTHFDTSSVRYFWSNWFDNSLCADYNRDGYTDIMLELNRESTISTQQFLFLGGPGVFDTLWDWRSEGFTGFYTHGVLGDFDGNGYPDFIRSSQYADPNTRLRFYSGGWPSIPQEPTWTFRRPGSNTAGFTDSKGSGDITGDGWPDFVQWFYTDTNPDSDYYDFWFGGPQADSIPDLSVGFRTLIGHTGRWRIIGDVNGDGINDLTAGVTDWTGEWGYQGIFYGGMPLDLDSADGRFAHPGPPQMGFSKPSVLGDINNDGCEDTGFRDQSLTLDYAYVFVYLGGNPPDSVWDLAVWDTFDGFRPGNRLSAAGDFNGDGIDDWMFSSLDPRNEGGLDRGRVTIIAGDRRFGQAADDHPSFTAANFRLGNPYPNPFNASVTIPLTIDGAHPKLVDVAIHNLLGQTVFSFGTTLFMPGNNTLLWNGQSSSGTDCTSGTYLVRATTGNQIVTTRMQLIK